MDLVLSRVLWLWICLVLRTKLNCLHVSDRLRLTTIWRMSSSIIPLGDKVMRMTIFVLFLYMRKKKHICLRYWAYFCNRLFSPKVSKKQKHPLLTLHAYLNKIKIKNIKRMQNYKVRSLLRKWFKLKKLQFSFAKIS